MYLLRGIICLLVKVFLLFFAIVYQLLCIIFNCFQRKFKKLQETNSVYCGYGKFCWPLDFTYFIYQCKEMKVIMLCHSSFPLCDSTPGYYLKFVFVFTVTVFVVYCYVFQPLHYLYKIIVGIWFEYRSIYVVCSVCVQYIL